MMLRLWGVACRIVGALTVAGFFLAAFTSVPNRIASRLTVLPDIGPAEAIVVLAVAANSDGSLADASMRRALSGIALYRQGLSRRIVFLGMFGEAEARERLAITMGVSPGDILIEGLAPTTRHEAERMRVVLRERLGVHSILLVTDVFHMRRAQALFERVGFSVRPATMELSVLSAGTPEDRLRLVRGVGEEVAARLYYRLFHYL